MHSPPPKLRNLYLILLAALLGFGGVASGRGDNFDRPLLYVSVDGEWPGTFDSIQAALSAAADGARIVVHGGDYDETVLINSGRSVSVAAEEGGTVRVRGLRVERLPLDKTVMVRGLHAVSDAAFPAGFSVRASRGNVWVEDCSADANDSLIGLTVLDCDSVVLAGCSIRGGVALSRSGASFFDCQIEAQSTVAGIDALDSCLTIQGGRVTGGRGRDAGSSLGELTTATRGLPGLHVWGASGSCDTTVAEAEIRGGAGGIGLGQAVPLESGRAYSIHAGTSKIRAEEEGALERPDTLAGERSLSVSLRGTPGQAAWMARASDWVVLGASLAVAENAAGLRLLGTVAANGWLELRFPMPSHMNLADLCDEMGATYLEQASGAMESVECVIAVFPWMPSIDRTCTTQTARRVRAKCLRPQSF